MEYGSKGHGLRELFADLSGILVLGKPPKEVAQYCLQERMKEHNLIK